MVAQNPVYDSIASEYRDSKLLGFRDAIEAETLRQIQSDLSGASVVDLACGEGHYTRRLKGAGAARVHGIDLSPEMIKLARVHEAAEPIGCTYEVADAGDCVIEQRVDVVVAMYLLNYAQTADQLQSFVDAAFAMLTPGGRFIGFNDNPASDPAHHGSMAQYGFERIGDPRRAEGSPVLYRMTTPDGAEFEFNNYYLSETTYRAAFERAGFVNFSWEGPLLAEAERTNSHWDHFMQHAPMIGFSASRPLD